MLSTPLQLYKNISQFNIENSDVMKTSKPVEYNTNVEILLPAQLNFSTIRS